MPDHTQTSDHDHSAEHDRHRSATRNRFFPGKLMKADQLGREQAYGIKRRRLVNRAVHGWGVVHGLALERSPSATQAELASPTPLFVGRGLALDPYGREIALVEPVELKATNTFLRKTSNGCEAAPIEGLPAGRYVLAAHYAERPFGDVQVHDRCGCDEAEKEFVRETVVFSLTAVDACTCAELPCDHAHHAAETDVCGSGSRGPHGTLCRWVTKAEVAADPKPLCEWNGYWIDPGSPVDLGCVQVAAHAKRCDPLLIAIVDACGPRRLVKRNDLLYDLIRGCDLTRISKISWAPRDEPDPVKWDTFAGWFRDSNRNDWASKTKFEVTFSRPVQTETLTLDTVTMTVAVESDEYWICLFRVPIVAIVPVDASGAERPKLTRQIRLDVRTDWVTDEIESGTRLRRGPFTVEIEIRGDLILDCDGQAVDANAVGRTPWPSGNGTPGGTFISCFDVDPPAQTRRPPRRGITTQPAVGQREE